MTRNSKALAAALLAALAIAGGVVQAASAHEFHSEASATDLTGSNVGNAVLALKPGGSKVTCTSATLSSTEIGLAVAAGEGTPTITGCSVGALPATVTESGCKLRLAGATTADSHNGGQSAAASLRCEHTGSITVKIYGGHASHTNNQAPICTLTFSDTHSGVTVNQGLHGVTFTNEGTGTTRHIKAVAKVPTVVYTSTGPQCAASGAPATGKEGIIEGTFTARGYTDSSAHGSADHVGIWVE